MKRKSIFRALIGAPIGLAIGTVITVIVSLCVGDGNYCAAHPDLIADCGNEINAVIVQACCSLLFGAVCGASSVVWESEKLSLLLQTVVHFAILCAAMFPLAFCLYWMPHNVWGVLAYLGIFVAIYAGIWFGLYFRIKAKIKALNDKLQVDIRE